MPEKRRACKKVTELVAETLEEIEDKEKRKNIIIFNIPESEKIQQRRGRKRGSRIL